MSRDWEGLLLIDKPVGPTSHKVIEWIRHATGQRRVGHAGTLDPPASGLLPVLLGRTTRLARFLPGTPKRYVGRLLLGRTSDTDDATGRILSETFGELPPVERVREAAMKLCGRGMQVPPRVSARKIGGRRMHELARRGIEVVAPATEVEVFRFDLEPHDNTGEYRLVAEVSAGTYIRALARDLGSSLGCGGLLVELRRVGIGPMEVDDAVAMSPDADPEPLRRALIPPEQIPLRTTSHRLGDPHEARRFVQGNPLEGPMAGPGESLFSVFGPTGRLLGVAEHRDGLLRPKVVLSGQPENGPNA